MKGQYVFHLSIVFKKKGGTYRLINDLRRINGHCKALKFQYEDIKCVLDIIQPQDRLITLDIKDGFYNIPVSPDSQKYLGIQWRNKTYVWTVLPFGLSVSPYFFCKTVREIIRFLRSQNVRLSVYCDDFLLCAAEADILNHRNRLLHLLESLGLQVNFKKSFLQPATKQNHIFYTLSTVNEDRCVWISIPEVRIKKVKHDLRLAVKRKKLSARALARLCGQLISMSKAIFACKTFITKSL